MPTTIPCSRRLAGRLSPIDTKLAEQGAVLFHTLNL